MLWNDKAFEKKGKILKSWYTTLNREKRETLSLEYNVEKKLKDI